MSRVALVACLVAASVASSPAAPPAPRLFPFEYTVDKLPNGLTSVVVPMPGRGLAALLTVIRTGSRDEWEPGHTGFAHLFEHVMFRGTKRFPGFKYYDLLHRLGVNDNAYTTEDYTCCHLIFAPEDLATLVDLEADRYLNLEYDEAAFKTEAGAVRGEWLQTLSNPAELLAERRQDLAFERHTYKHTVIGFEKDVLAMPAMYDFSKSFFRRYYRPENVVVLVVGDVDAGLARDLVKKHFGPWAPGYEAPRVPVEPPQLAERRADVSFPGETLPTLSVSYKGPAFSVEDREFVACKLAGDLALGEDSPLYRKLVLTDRTVESLEPEFHPSRDPGLLTVVAKVKRDADVPAVEREIERALEGLGQARPDEARLEREKSRRRYSFLMELDNVEGVAFSLVPILALTGDVDDQEELFRRYAEVTPEDVQAAARRWFVPAGRTVLVLRPASAAAPLAALASADAVPVVTYPDATDPTVSLRLWFKAGSQDDPPGKEGLCSLVGDLLSQGGTRTHTYEELKAKLHPLAASYSAQVDREMTVVLGRVHRDRVADYWPLLREALLEPGFRDDDFQRLRDNAVNALASGLRFSDDEELAKAALYGAAFAGTRYAHPPTGLVQSLKRLTAEDARRFWRERFTAGNVVVGIGGSYPEAFVEQIRKELAGLPPGVPAACPPPEPSRPKGLDVLIVEKEGADGCSLSAGWPLDVRRGDKDFYALWVANSWLGEHRNSFSHLFQVIREARGLNYGDYTYLEAFPWGGWLQFPPQNVGRRRQLFELWVRTVPVPARHFALRAALRELQGLIDKGMTAADFDRTRAFLRKYLPHLATTTNARLGYRLDDRFYGLREPHLDAVRRRLDELTLDEVNAAIRAHLQVKDGWVVAVTPDAAGFERALSVDAASPVTYPTEKPAEVLAEDEVIARWPLRPGRIRRVDVRQLFERSPVGE